MKTTAWILLGISAALIAGPNAFAFERIEIKGADKRAKENIAKAHLKTIDLQNIEDPEARKAISEILNYLDLQTKK